MNGRSPAYLMIADDLRQKIKDGVYLPGVTLPSTVELQNMYGVSQGTVRSAMQVLRNEGIIDVPGPGRPITVKLNRPRIVRDAERRYQAEKNQALHGGLPTDTSIARDMGLSDEDASVTLLGHETMPAAGQIGWILGLDSTDEINRYSFLVGVNVIDGVGTDECRIAHHYFPADLDRRVARAQPGNAVEPGSVIWPGGTMYQLAQQHIEPARVDDLVTARMPLPEEREWLNLSDGVPVLVIRKITRDAIETAYEVVEIIMSGERAEAVYRTHLEPWPPNALPWLSFGDSDSE